jgi:subtilisin family serine protease
LLAATFGTGQDGQASADALSVLAALSWLDGKADIINMSFSGPRNDEIELAIRAMAAKGVVFVAAAGNHGPNGPASYPAAYSDVIAVTAVAHDRRGYRHATHGDYVDMAAPGVDVPAALPTGKSGLRTGTSFAAPFVTGLLAAMPAARKGAANKSDLLARISTVDLGEPGRDPVFGEGLPQAPERCDEIGGVASLPWSPEAQRMSLGAAASSVAQRGGGPVPASKTAPSYGWGMGFAP